MHKKSLFTLCLGVLLGMSVTMYGADSPNELTINISAEQLEAWTKEWWRERFGEEMPEPTPYSFVASCKADDGTYLIVKSNGMFPQVRIGDLSGEFQDVPDVKGSILQGWGSAQCLVISAWLEIVKGVLIVKEEKHLVTETKHLLLFGSKDKIEQGVFDSKEWTFEDLLSKNPAIPAHARLTILNAVAVKHPLKGHNSVMIQTQHGK